MFGYFVTRKVCDGNIAGDFKHINSHSYPLFKAGHVQRIQVIKGNDSNVYLSAVCLPEMRKDRDYKIQVVLSPVGEIIFAEDGCPAGKGPKGSCKHIAAFCYALKEFVRLGLARPFYSCEFFSPCSYQRALDLTIMPSTSSSYILPIFLVRSVIMQVITTRL